jgi:hypothetical protein
MVCFREILDLLGVSNSIDMFDNGNLVLAAEAQNELESGDAR